MPTTLIEKVSIVNSAARTLLAVTLMAGIGYGGWYGYTLYTSRDEDAQRAVAELASTRETLARAQDELRAKDVLVAEQAGEINSLNTRVALQQQEIERLDTAMRLLKLDHRVARLVVLKQTPAEGGEGVVSRVRFQELNDQGEGLGEPHEFEVQGDVIYVDTWVVKFDDKYVEQADLARGTSLVLFRRIFGESQRPQDGYVLDREGQRPTGYTRLGEMSDFEAVIWRDFWTVANDEAKQSELGIRAMHGEAAFYQIREGRQYRITRRASGGLTFEDDGEAPANAPAA